MERSRNNKEKKSLILKTLQRCKINGHIINKSRERHVHRTPEGCLTVYVGPDKERIVIRTELLNHPLFKELLDQAETEFGYACDGPIELPCGLDHFDQVLSDIMDIDVSLPCRFPASPICGFGKGAVGFRVFDVSRIMAADRFWMNM